MCSLAGLLNCGDATHLQRMSALMHHRGPDASGLQWFPALEAGLAHNRLSIVDLSPLGAQPMASADGRHWLTFNGEIYNHRELRRELEAHGHHFRSSSDTEVLLHALLEWGGEACLQRLNGMFAFAWLDTATGRLFAARDHLGIKPLYYTCCAGGLAFASEIKALLSLPFVSAIRDDAALRNPSRFLLSPSTGFQGIHKLPPGHCFTWHQGTLDVRQYWSIEPTESLTSEAEAVEHIGHLIEAAVQRQMVADVPVGTFLSGGLDSSLISALMRQQSAAGQIEAFTIKFSAQDQKFEQASEDVVYARQVAQQFGLRLHEFEVEPRIIDLLPRMVWHMDEPLSDPAAINTYLISQAARDMGIIVLLNGIGGDEVFGGYRKHLACLHAERYQSLLPAPLRRGVSRLADLLPVATAKRGLLPLRMLKRFLSYASLPEAERYLASDLSLNPQAYAQLYPGADYHTSLFWQQQHATLQQPQLSYLTRMCLNDTRVFLPEHNLTYADKASMAASIETRPPLVDKDVVTAAFRLAPHLRIHGTVQKHLLKQIGLRHLPHSVVHRPKASFNSPLRAWIRGPLRSVVDDLLSERQVAARGLHNPHTVRHMVERDRSGAEDHSMWIWTLLTVELWHRTFLDRTPSGPVTLN